MQETQHLTDLQYEILIRWLKGRKAMIEEGWEDLDQLKPLLALIDAKEKK